MSSKNIQDPIFLPRFIWGSILVFSVVLFWWTYSVTPEVASPAEDGLTRLVNVTLSYEIAFVILTVNYVVLRPKFYEDSKFPQSRLRGFWLPFLGQLACVAAIGFFALMFSQNYSKDHFFGFWLIGMICLAGIFPKYYRWPPN
jgi:glucan phosphoethanolaminetransferase (alkaline phosphatase superfamily)